MTDDRTETMLAILKRMEADLTETRRELRAFLATPPAGVPEFAKQTAAGQADATPPQERIRAAATASDETDAAIDWARTALKHYRRRNAEGVYSHPHALRMHLVEAHEAIQRAEKIVAETIWPTDEDYGAV
jgi:hypothetical protein